MNAFFWLRRPDLIAARLRYWIWERRNSDKPWLTPDAVEFCSNILTPQMQGWEFGSGRSTAWFASRLCRLVSVECDRQWYEVVAARIAAAGLKNVDYRYIPQDDGGAAGEQVAFDHWPKYVESLVLEPDETFHFVVIDGHYRTECIRAAVPKIAPGGFLLIDDIERWPDRAMLPISFDWVQVHESTNGIKRTGIWQKSVQNSVSSDSN